MAVLTIIQVVLNKVIGYNVLDLQVKWITKWHKTGQSKKTQWTWTSERYKHTSQLNFTRQIQRMTIQDDTIQVNK